VKGLTWTLSEPGKVPDEGVTRSQGANTAGDVAAQVAFPELTFKLTDCAGGNTAPTCHENVKAAGAAVTVCAFRNSAQGRRVNTRSAICFIPLFSATNGIFPLRKASQQGFNVCRSATAKELIMNGICSRPPAVGFAAARGDRAVQNVTARAQISGKRERTPLGQKVLEQCRRSRQDADEKESQMREPIGKPWIVMFLQLVSWITIATATFCAVLGAASGQSDVVGAGLGGAIAGCLTLALCVAVQKLHQIEHHLWWIVTHEQRQRATEEEAEEDVSSRAMSRR
jgi:hypothetical protein